MYMDLGEKQKTLEAHPIQTKSPPINYPTLNIRKDETPHVKIGSSFEARVKLRLSGVRYDKYERKWNCEYDVMAIDFGKPKSGAEDLEYKIGEEMDKMEKESARNPRK